MILINERTILEIQNGNAVAKLNLTLFCLGVKFWANFSSTSARQKTFDCVKMGRTYISRGNRKKLSQFFRVFSKNTVCGAFWPSWMTHHRQSRRRVKVHTQSQLSIDTSMARNVSSRMKLKSFSVKSKPERLKPQTLLEGNTWERMRRKWWWWQLCAVSGRSD